MTEIKTETLEEKSKKRKTKHKVKKIRPTMGYRRLCLICCSLPYIEEDSLEKNYEKWRQKKNRKIIKKEYTDYDVDNYFFPKGMIIVFYENIK